MGFDDISNNRGGTIVGLGLGLGVQDELPENCNKQKKKKKEKREYPSLTLGPSSSPSAVVSWSSIKRETSEDEDHQDLLFDHQVEDKAIIRKKLRLTKDQSALLEDSFKHHSTLTPKQKQELARKLNLRARQVEVWFQNRRARTKLKQTEVECEVLKKCCEALSEENARLQKELQHLKSATEGSLYVQVPAGSLSICPSCQKISSAAGNTNNNNTTTTSALLLASKPNPHHYFYNKTNYPFTQSSAACLATY